ncbi:MAG: type II and III secretion system protein [Burkholderiales bacterium]|nr:MAG: type II and III secretion system protein [Burkholderiales bacterium]
MTHRQLLSVVPRIVAAAAIASIAGLLPTAFGQTPAPDPAEPLTLYVGEAHVINEPGVRRIAVGNGKVLQATALDDRQVLVLPEAPGQSTLLLWGRSGPERSYVFNVLPADTKRLVAEVRAMLGDARKVTVRVVGDKVLVEGAEVSEEVSARIAEIARRYPQVVNLLPKVGQERMIAMDVKFIEIRRELLENIGVKWGGSMQGPSFQVIGDVQRSAALRSGGSAEGSGLQVAPRIAPFASSLSIVSSLTSMLNLLVQNGDAVILAEPRLSCRSGGSARFVAGGELPIPVAGALGTASVGFKEYGVKFDVSPVASDSGLISARIATEISAINFEVAVREVPGLTKRRAETDVNLRENETLVIAGLLTEEGARNMDRVAGAAELPVLGALFRSRLFRDRQTELVVFITPRFVEGTPMPAAASSIRTEPMRAPTRLLPELPAGAEAPAALDGMPAEVGAAAARPAAAWRGSSSAAASAARPDPVPVPARVPAPVSPAAGGVPAPAAPTPPAEGRSPAADAAARIAGDGEDRGTAARWRASRERVRMVD